MVAKNQSVCDFPELKQVDLAYQICKMYNLDNILLFLFYFILLPHQPPIFVNEVGVIGVIFGKVLKSEEMERVLGRDMRFLVSSINFGSK